MSGLIFDGIAGSQAIDSSGEILDIEGADITTLQEGKGFFNFEHLQADNGKHHVGAELVGKIIYAKKIFKDSDCENDRQRKFFKEVKGIPYIYVVGRLFDQAGHEGAKALAAIMRDAVANKEKMVMGMSVEGSTLKKEGNTLKSSVIKLVALTIRPCNKTASLEVVKDPDAPNGFEQEHGEEDILASVAKDAEKLDKSNAGLVRLSGWSSEYTLDDLDELAKATEAGSYDAAPSQLTGGAALQREHIIRTHKDKAMKTLKSYLDKNYEFKKEELKAALKAEVPEASDEFLEHFADIAEDYTVKMRKSEELNKVVLTPASTAARMEPHQAYGSSAYDKVETYDNGDGTYHHVYYGAPIGNDYQPVLHSISSSASPLSRGMATSASGIHSADSIGNFANNPWQNGGVIVHGETTSRGPKGTGTKLYRNMLKIHGRMASDSSTSEGANGVWNKLAHDPEFKMSLGHEQGNRHWAEYTGPKPTPMSVIQGDGRSLEEQIKEPQTPYSFQIHNIKSRSGHPMVSAVATHKSGEEIGSSEYHIDPIQKKFYTVGPYWQDKGIPGGHNYSFEHNGAKGPAAFAVAKQTGYTYGGDLPTEKAEPMLKKSESLEINPMALKVEGMMLNLRKALAEAQAGSPDAAAVAPHLHNVYIYRHSPTGERKRHLAGRFMTAGNHLNVLEDYHDELWPRLTEGRIGPEQLGEMAKLKSNPDFDVASAHEINSGARPDLWEAPEKQEPKKPRSSFAIHRTGQDTPDHLEFISGQAHLNGNPLDDGKVKALLHYVGKGHAKVGYMKHGDENAIQKMESFITNLMKADEHGAETATSVHAALGALDALVQAGHLDPKHAEALRAHAFKDPMTGNVMGNKFAYTDFKNRAKDKGGVHVGMDANNFKLVNDRFGHESGDQAIKAMGTALKSAMDEAAPGEGKLFRVGGDEFTAHVPSHEHAARFVRAAQKHLDAIPPIGGVHKLSMGFGLGAHPEHADKALYEAKKQKFDPAGMIGTDSRKWVSKFDPHQTPHVAHSMVPGHEGAITMDTSSSEVKEPPKPETKAA